MEATRYFAVALAGLALDLAVAWGAARLMGLPLWLAATAGFAVAAALNYALHELWTFRDGARQISAGRALRYATGLAVTLAARVAAVAVLAALLGDDRVLTILVVAAGVSFGVNFLISKHFVFQPDPTLKDPLS